MFLPGFTGHSLGVENKVIKSDMTRAVRSATHDATCESATYRTEGLLSFGHVYATRPTRREPLTRLM